MGQLFNRFKSISKACRSGTSSGSAMRGYDVSDTQPEDDYLTRLIEDASESPSGFDNDSGKSQKYSDDPQFDSSCQILGVLPNADLNKIKTGYKNQIRKYHPDLYFKHSESEISDAEQKTAAINAAYDYLLRKRGL